MENRRPSKLEKGLDITIGFAGAFAGASLAYLFDPKNNWAGLFMSVTGWEVAAFSRDTIKHHLNPERYQRPKLRDNLVYPIIGYGLGIGSANLVRGYWD